jgi:hypothetical protein
MAMVRRLAVLVVVLAFVGASLPVLAGTTAEGGQFWDDDGWTHEGNIEAIAALGVTEGCAPEGTAFCPDMAVTRAQMASFIARALGLPAASPDRFDDVTADNVHAGNIAAIAEVGITLGCNTTGTLYCPNAFVSRAQMASFLARALELDPVATGSFQDITADYTVHEQNINAIAADGITLGCDTSGTLYCPGNLVIRGQMASFLARALDLTPVDVAPRLYLLDFASCDAGTCSGSGEVTIDGGFFVRHGFVFDLSEPDFESLKTDPGTGFVMFLDGIEMPSTSVASTFADSVARWDIIDFPSGLSGEHEFELQWIRLGEVVQSGTITLTFN